MEKGCCNKPGEKMNMNTPEEKKSYDELKIECDELKKYCRMLNKKILKLIKEQAIKKE